ncbi:MAG: thiamine pyrophosphate-dependent enzyme [Mycobacteriales bacterium]
MPATRLDPTVTGTSVAGAVVGFLTGRLGCDRIFTVPGEAVLPLLSLAGRSGIDLVAARHEAGAGFAALADAWLTGRPGVVVVNRSPGAANVGIALDATRADPTPLLLLVGTARRGQDLGIGYQSADPAAQLGGVATVVAVPGGDVLPACLARVEELLSSPVPGAVVLVVPQDVWNDPAAAAGPPAPTRPVPAAGTAAGTAAEQVAEALVRAERPVLVAGRLLRRPSGPADPSALLDRLARGAGVPVLLANKQQDLVDNTLPGYGGDLHQGTHPRTHARMGSADLVVLLGDQPGEVHLKGWYDRQRVLTVHPVPAGVGEHLAADPGSVLTALAARHWPPVGPDRADWAAGWTELEHDLATPRPRRLPDGLDFTLVTAALDAALPADALVCLDAGNFGSWVHRYVRFRAGQRLLSLADGAMGFAVPAAVAAVRREPDRPVVAIVGDGGLLMTGNELAALPRTGRGPVVVLADNAGYGAIRAQAARSFPGADVAADLGNPDFVRWAQAFGLPAEAVAEPDEVVPALDRALAARGGYLLHVRTSRIAAHPNFDLPG